MSRDARVFGPEREKGMRHHSVRLGHRLGFALSGAAILGAVLLLAPSCSRRAQSESGTAAATAPLAPVVNVSRQSLSNEIEIASEFRPFQEIDLHAKESGYVKQLFIDWGTHVKAGQLMAVLEIPELEQQVERDKAAERGSEQDLARAHEELTRAQSAYQVAHLTSTRMAAVQKTQPGLVAQEEVDVAQGKDEESGAEVSASRDAVAAAEQELAGAKAMLQKDEALFSYARISAPFDGVVTELDAYTGALLPAGTSSSQNGLALCHLSQNDLLRLVIPVPETVVPDVHLGEPVQVRVTVLNRTFQGKVTRFSDQIDLETRTMHTEVQVPNANYQLVPGMYAYVQLPTVRTVNVLAVPIQAVRRSGNDTGTVLVVNGQHAVESRAVKLGMETADNVEITSGLEENELVIFGEQNRYQPGEIVNPKQVTPGSLNGSE